jgi:hypothetical protein
MFADGTICIIALRGEKWANEHNSGQGFNSNLPINYPSHITAIIIHCYFMSPDLPFLSWHSRRQGFAPCSYFPSADDEAANP